MPQRMRYGVLRFQQELAKDTAVGFEDVTAIARHIAILVVKIELWQTVPRDSGMHVVHRVEVIVQKQ